jgi:cytochrome c biogenesis protein CcdA
LLTLLVVGFIAGLITALSPCVLPVLPLLLAGGASGGRRRPYAIVAGLVTSFTAFTLTAATVLSLLGVPADLLRNLALALFVMVAATLLFPQVAYLLERPLFFLTRRHVGDTGSGFIFGLGLGLVFVPCAGPVLAAVSVLAASERFSVELVLLTLAYAMGAAIPKLGIAIFGQRAAMRVRRPVRFLRPALGVVVAVTAGAIALGVDRPLQTAIPGYTRAV